MILYVILWTIIVYGVGFASAIFWRDYQRAKVLRIYERDNINSTSKVTRFKTRIDRARR
jgi:hypothetical protein